MELDYARNVLSHKGEVMKQGDKLLQELKDKAQLRDRIRKLAWLLTRPLYEENLLYWAIYFKENRN